jgi:O-ureido-D-serine cyclo-ligase
MERPWEKAVPVSAVDASAEERAVGDAVVEELRRRFGRTPAYARVDLVLDAGGSPQILEVELIDPLLFLALADGAADRLAAAVISRVVSRR